MDWEERGLRQTRSDGSSRRRSGRGDERDRGRREVWRWGAVILALICELERTHMHTKWVQANIRLL